MLGSGVGRTTGRGWHQEVLEVVGKLARERTKNVHEQDLF